MRTAYAGALVAIFFCARCCSIALAAILWASARSLNSLSPKRCAASLPTSVQASASISVSMAARIAWARTFASARCAGDSGVDGMMASRTRGDFLLKSQLPPLCTKIPPTFKTLTATPKQSLFFIDFLTRRGHTGACCKIVPTRLGVSSMKRQLCGLLALALSLGATAPAHADYTFTSIDVPGSDNTSPGGVNSSGQIAGNYNPSGTFPFRGFLYSNGTYTTFDVPNASTSGTGINNAGQVVGSYLSTAYHGFLRDGSNYTTLDGPGATDTRAFGINDMGQISGSYATTPSKFPNHGFLLSNGSYTTFDVPGSTDTIGFGVNNATQIVGRYADAQARTHGFLRSGDSYTTLDFPGASFTEAIGINNLGQIVGAYVTTGSHAFLYSNGTYTSLDFPGAFLTDADGINDLGEIVGSYTTTDAASRRHGFLATPLATPVPEPSNGLLLTLGIACVLCCTWLRARRAATG